MNIRNDPAFNQGDLRRAIMDLKRDMAPAIRVGVKGLSDDFLNKLICKRFKYYWHYCIDSPTYIWVYRDELLKEIIEYMDANPDNPLYLWAQLKMQGFSNRSIIERLEEEKQDSL